MAYRLEEAGRALIRHGSRRRFAASILVLMMAAGAAPHPAAAQNFVAQGPAPELGNVNWIASADASPNGTDAGAVQSVLLDSVLGAGTMFAGSTNGGIWKTTNGGVTWTALTQNQASLSIASLSLDPLDPSGRTIVAGIGAVDNGEYSQFNLSSAGRSGALTGLLYTTNGGASWSTLGGPNGLFAGQSVVSAMARGNTILAATFEVQNADARTADYGLFRSIDGGQTFTNMAGAAGSGLPAGAVSSLVADPSDPSTFYAAVKIGANKAGTAVYISHDKGATWAPIFTAANAPTMITAGGDATAITLAAGPGGSVAVAISDVGSHRSLLGVFLGSNQGATWNQLTAAPNVVSGLNQTPANLHIAIDPNNQNNIYLSGDTPPGSFTGVQLYRLQYTGNDAAAWTSLTSLGTAPNSQDASTVHSDSRSMTFDQNGNLILSSDGGIYKLTNPGGPGSWSGLNGNLGVFEGYSIAYDANSKRVGIALQDNGVALQHAPGSARFDTINGGDGTNVAINDVTLRSQGQSVIYSTEENLTFAYRLIANAQGQPLGPGTDPINSPGGATINCSLGANHNQDCGVLTGAAPNGAFSGQFVLNRIDPTRIVMTGVTDVFTTQDTTLSGNVNVNATSVNLVLTDLGSVGPNGLPSVVSYGTQDNTQALAVGAYVNPSTTISGSVWFGTGGALTKLTAYSGDTPTGIVFDNRNSSNIYVADASNLYYTTNANAGPTATFTTINLSEHVPGFVRPTSVEFISNNGVNALLVGGLNTPLSCNTATPDGCIILPTQSPITVADADINGGLSGWRAFGQGLPNALVYAMAYNQAVDVLAVSSIGAGAYVLYDVTSYFPQATVLRFGLADNDSAPDASFLTNGNYSSRQLIKYGTGTLTIAGDATYTGSTTISAGTLVLGTGGASGSVKGNITFSDQSTIASDPNCNLASECDPSTNKFLVFNRSDTYTFGGVISGAGQVIQAGPGTTVLSGVNTYTGPTTVDAGTLSVTGSITSAVFVNAGGVLSGSGTVGSATINAGGLLAPANPGSPLTVQGNLVFATAGAYLVEINNNLADRVNVTGTATLAGDVFASLLGTSVSKRYTILNATGGITGTFAGVNNLPTTLAGNLGYDANNVFLNLSLNYNALGSLNSNQQNVANALSNFFNSNGSIPVSFATLTQAGLSQVAGESATGSEQTTFQAMTQFITTLLDPFISGRETTQGTPGANGYAEEDTGASAYAASGKTLSQNERAAYAAVFTKAPLRQFYDPHWSIWASAFGGSQTTSGNAFVGSNSDTSSIFGMAAGADYLLSPRTIAGFALAGGGTSFNVSNAGSGRSDLFQAGGFVRHNAGPAYVSAALAYGWQDVTTNRLVMGSNLRAEFNANALSGRLEGGYRFATRWFGITPYAAGQFTSFFLPSYAEAATFGSNAFALGYGSQTVTDTRTELGFRTDRSFALLTGLLTLRSRFAWAHDYNPNRAIAATFQALPGSSFVVNGAAQASESALTTLSAEMKWRNGWSASATFEGEFSQVTASYAGKGVVRYVW
ncbi:MAG TPA: autotransporter domain-containing protein [Bradyrhizobium sp.]|uniref:autotransporter domain-containing protein n=1 Tax=Bradyrhizobium sp. TaxID=376 RepID=UPI002B730583|nr:autotransporter domain-containing protein [Bradyrhizobium sp.]HLZ03243.1 autotransporter domain-containing protein [Bradyrhizobium sp.]